MSSRLTDLVKGDNVGTPLYRLAHQSHRMRRIHRRAPLDNGRTVEDLQAKSVRGQHGPLYTHQNKTVEAQVHFKEEVLARGRLEAA